jgi:AcrR family transcriptional regulator
MFMLAYCRVSSEPLPAGHLDEHPHARRVPVQHRSRVRVETILRAAEDLVVEGGVEALTTRGVARLARLPIGSLYTYFADREAIIAELIERHVGAMDRQVTADAGRIRTLTLRSLVESVVDTYRAGYAQRPSFVILWFRGRVSSEIVEYVRERNARLARRFHAFAVAAELVSPATDRLVFEFAAEMIDGFLALAYRDDLAGDDRTVAEGVEMIVRYLEAHATERGIAGVPADEVTATLATAGL